MAPQQGLQPATELRSEHHFQQYSSCLVKHVPGTGYRRDTQMALTAVTAWTRNKAVAQSKADKKGAPYLHHPSATPTSKTHVFFCFAQKAQQRLLSG